MHAELARWRSVAELIELSRTNGTDPHGPEEELFAGMATGVTHAIDVLAAVESRFTRDRVCVGVSGWARVGKSTLLQTVFGLTDEQIPNGSDVPRGGQRPVSAAGRDPNR